MVYWYEVVHIMDMVGGSNPRLENIISLFFLFKFSFGQFFLFSSFLFFFWRGEPLSLNSLSWFPLFGASLRLLYGEPTCFEHAQLS